MVKEKPKGSTDVRKLTPGVYALIHMKTKSAYVGSSRRCVLNRLSYHLAKLRGGDHPSNALQCLWNSTEVHEWKFRLLESCEPAICREREEYWCGRFKNLLCAHPASGYELSIETRIKQKTGRAEYLKSEYARKSLSERAKAQHAAGKFGRATWLPGQEPKLTAESRARMSKRMREQMAAHTKS